MARKRTTIEVSAIKDEINRRLRDTAPHMTAERRALASILEHILHETGNYRGFNYNEWSPGPGYAQWVADGSPSPTPHQYFGDMSRVHYY